MAVMCNIQDLICCVVWILRSSEPPQMQQVRYSDTPHRAASHDLMMFAGEDKLSSSQQTSSYSEFL